MLVVITLVAAYLLGTAVLLWALVAVRYPRRPPGWLSWALAPTLLGWSLAPFLSKVVQVMGSAVLVLMLLVLVLLLLLCMLGEREAL